MSTSTLSARADVTPKRLRGALLRYRVMAMITGAFLLLLCVDMTVKYGFRGGEDIAGGVVAKVHGWIYVVYLAAVIDLWTTVRASWVKLVALVLSGVVPVLSFWQERQTTRQIQALVDDAESSDRVAV